MQMYESGLPFQTRVLKYYWIYVNTNAIQTYSHKSHDRNKLRSKFAKLQSMQSRSKPRFAIAPISILTSNDEHADDQPAIAARRNPPRLGTGHMSALR